MDMLPLELLPSLITNLTTGRQISKAFYTALQGEYAKKFKLQDSMIVDYLKDNHHSVGIYWDDDFQIFNHYNTPIYEITLNGNDINVRNLTFWQRQCYLDRDEMMNHLKVKVDLYTLYKSYQQQIGKLAKLRIINHIQDAPIVYLLGSALCMHLLPKSTIYRNTDKFRTQLLDILMLFFNHCL